MTNDRSAFFRKAAILAIPLLTYLLAVIFQSQFWGNIISPVCAFTASGVLFYTFLRLRKRKSIKYTVLLESLACLAWGVADVLWAVVAFSGSDPRRKRDYLGFIQPDKSVSLPVHDCVLGHPIPEVERRPTVCRRDRIGYGGRRVPLDRFPSTGIGPCSAS